MIQFVNSLNENRLRMAFNNDIIRFYSDKPAAPQYCDIKIAGIPGVVADADVRLYPNPQNQFYFNFKPYVSALINSLNFEDTLLTVPFTQNPDTFVYNAANGVFLQKTVHFTMVFGDVNETKSVILEWLCGAEQLQDAKTFTKSDNLVLSPFAPGSANTYYLKYWQGYPFDVSLYTRSSTFLLHNTTTLFSQQFTNPLPPPGIPAFEMPGLRGPVCRLFFSDGRTDETLEDLLPITEGRNSIRFKTTGLNQRTDKFIHLDKVPYRCGVYLKWLNKYGGYSYWLFENTFAIDRSTKYTGEVDNDNTNPEDAFGRVLQMGKESQDTIKITADLITPEERTVTEGLLDSPKIYLFTGQPFARNSYRDWVEVTLKTTSARIKNFRQPLTNFSFDLELPQRYTQTL